MSARLTNPQAANEHNVAIQTTTKSVHEETVAIVDAQMKQMDVQLQALDDILTRVKTQNSLHHEAHVQSLDGLAVAVHQSYTNIGAHLTESSARAQQLEQDVLQRSSVLGASLQPLQAGVHAPLADLRAGISSSKLTDYTATGATPHKLQYQLPASLPRTAEHEVLLSKFRGDDTSSARSSTTPKTSPIKTAVFADNAPDVPLHDSIPAPTHEPSDPPRKLPRPESASGGLKEVDVNVAASSIAFASAAAASHSHNADAAKSGGKEPSYQRPLKRQNTGIGSVRMHNSAGSEKDLGASVGLGSKLPKKAVAEGRENMPFGGAGASLGGREGRNLRSRNS